MKCPICQKEVKLTDPEMPFCSERCRLVDLGMWANEEYRIPVVNPSPDLERGDAQDDSENPSHE